MKYNSEYLVPTESLDFYGEPLKKHVQEVLDKNLAEIIFQESEKEVIIRFGDYVELPQTNLNCVTIRRTIDIEPLIRCKDCKHQRKHFLNGGAGYYSCDLIADPHGGAGADGEPEEYCSAAERRTE